MNNNYDGNDRRSSDANVARLVGKLEAYMETTAANQKAHYEAMKSELRVFTEQLKSIDNKLELQVERLSDDIIQLEAKENIITRNNEKSNAVEHTQIIGSLTGVKKNVLSKTEILYERVTKLDSKLKEHFVLQNAETASFEKRLTELEGKDKVAKAKFIDDFLSVVKKVIFGAVATGIVGFIGFLIFEYLN